MYLSFGIGGAILPRAVVGKKRNAPLWVGKEASAGSVHTENVLPCWASSE